MGDAALAEGFDLRRLPEGFIANPYPFYAALRAHAPVHEFGDGQILLTRYADLERVYKDAATFSSDKTVEFGAKFTTGRCPPRSTGTTPRASSSTIRRATPGSGASSRALTPRAVAAMEPGIVALVDGLLDAAEVRGRIDLIEDFAAAIPVEVIGNLLGVPRDERGPLRDWSLAILGALEPVLTPEIEAAGNRAVTAFLAYLDRLVADRRRHPGDPDKDILTRLIQGEVGGERLSPEELLQNCIFILNAGHETTTNLIGNGLHLLAEHPEARARLLAEPDLMRKAVEEILRFESSNQLGNRVATTDFAIDGRTFPAGTQITLGIGAANRDPAQFPDPDTFDVARDPNRHLAFASGIHHCVGMAVARLEGRIALGRFLARFPDYRLDGVPERSQRVRFRGFSRLPARLG